MSEDELAVAVNVDPRNSLIISGIEDHLLRGSARWKTGPRQSILGFATNKYHAKTLTRQCRARGIDAECVLGDTPKEQREDNLRRFRDGKLTMMWSCGVFIEGVDVPRIDALVMAAPVMSPGKYMQMIGRGSRVFPGKDYCVVLDVVDVLGKHHVQTISDAFGVRGVDFLGEDVLAKIEIVERAQKLGMNVEPGENIEKIEQKLDLMDGVARGTIKIETTSQLVDVFDTAAIKEEVQRSSEFPWIRASTDRYILPMFGETTELRCNPLGQWVIQKGDQTVPLDKAVNKTPFKWADRQVKNMHDLRTWKAKLNGAKWQNEPATPKQVAFLQRMGVGVVPKDMTRGAASQLGDYLSFVKREARAA